MPKILYCEHCQQLFDSEGFILIKRVNPNDDCPICKNRFRTFHVKNNYWFKIVIQFCIIIGFLTFFLISLYLFNNGIQFKIYIFYSIILIFSISIIILIIIDRLSILNLENITEKLKKEHPDLKIGNELFKRGALSLFSNTSNTVMVYPNGIKTCCYSLDKKGHLISNTGRIRLISNNNIVRIFRYKYYLWKEPKLPNGFHLETKDKEICIIKSGMNGNDYKYIFKALRENFRDRWKGVYKNKLLVNKETLNLQR